MGKLDGLLWWLGYSPVCPCDVEGEPRDSGGITAIEEGPGPPRMIVRTASTGDDLVFLEDFMQGFNEVIALAEGRMSAYLLDGPARERVNVVGWVKGLKSKDFLKDQTSDWANGSFGEDRGDQGGSGRSKGLDRIYSPQGKPKVDLGGRWYVVLGQQR